MLWLNIGICVGWSLGELVSVLIIFSFDNILRRKILFFTNKKEDCEQVENAKRSDFFQWDLVDVSHLYQSPIFSLGAILAYRIFGLIFFVGVFLIDEFGDKMDSVLYWLRFYTHWTLISFGFYYLFGVFICLARCLELSRQKTTLPTTKNDQTSLEQRGCTIPEKIFIIFGAVTLTCTLFLTFGYWAFQQAEEEPITIDSYTKHGINCIIIVLDLFLIRTPVISSHFGIVLLYTQCYAVFLWIYGSISNDWIYASLNFNTTFGTVVNIMSVPTVLAFFSITFPITSFREWVFFSNNKPKEVTQKIPTAQKQA